MFRRRIVAPLAAVILAGVAPRAVGAQSGGPFGGMLKIALSSLGTLGQNLQLRGLTATPSGDSVVLAGDAALYGSPVQVHALFARGMQVRRIVIGFPGGMPLRQDLLASLAGDSAARTLAGLESLVGAGRIDIGFTDGARMNVVRLTAGGGPWLPLGAASAFSVGRLELSLTVTDPTTSAKRLLVDLRGDLNVGGSSAALVGSAGQGRRWRLEATFASVPLRALIDAAGGAAELADVALPASLLDARLDRLTVVLEPHAQRVSGTGTSTLGETTVEMRVGRGRPQFLVAFAPPPGFTLANVHRAFAPLDLVRLQGTAMVLASRDGIADPPAVRRLGGGPRAVRRGLTLLARSQPGLMPPELPPQMDAGVAVAMVELPDPAAPALVSVVDAPTPSEQAEAGGTAIAAAMPGTAAAPDDAARRAERAELTRSAAPATPATASIERGTLAGSGTGAPFEDRCDDVAEVRLRAGWWMDGLQLVCRDAGGASLEQPARGGVGGTLVSFALEAGERIVAVTGSWMGPAGPFVYSVQIHTDRRASPEFGNGGPDRGQRPFRLEVPPGSRFAGWHGTSADFLTGLGILVAR